MQTPVIETQPGPMVARPSTFGALSIAAPFIGGVLVYLLIFHSDQIVPAYILGLLLVPLSPICGVIFAVVAWIRREPSWIFPWIGLLLNLGVLLFLYIERNNLLVIGC
jgi:hypothetical protein